MKQTIEISLETARIVWGLLATEACLLENMGNKDLSADFKRRADEIEVLFFNKLGINPNESPLFQKVEKEINKFEQICPHNVVFIVLVMIKTMKNRLVVI